MINRPRRPRRDAIVLRSQRPSRKPNLNSTILITNLASSIPRAGGPNDRVREQPCISGSPRNSRRLARWHERVATDISQASDSEHDRFEVGPQSLEVLSETGLLGLLIPEDQGGSGGNVE